MSSSEAVSKNGLTADTIEGVVVSLRQDRAYGIAVPLPVSPSKVAGFERSGTANSGERAQPCRNRPEPKRPPRPCTNCGRRFRAACHRRMHFERCFGSVDDEK